MEILAKKIFWGNKDPPLKSKDYKVSLISKEGTWLILRRE
jgi:hypothetical protein